jgi:hypothetical protein
VTKYVLAVVGGVALLWAWLDAFAYFDPARGCHIHIEVDLLAGDRDGIRRAIDLVRRQDPRAYRTLCGFVDRIIEQRQCDGADPHVAGRDPRLLQARTATGCYVKGSRTVILRREPGADPAVVKRRAEALARLAGHSAGFWLRTVAMGRAGVLADSPPTPR